MASHVPGSWHPTEGDFLPGDIWQYLEVFRVAQPMTGVTGTQDVLVEARDVAKHPFRHSVVLPNKNNLIQNVISAEVKEPWAVCPRVSFLIATSYLLL